jgi:hypothetical protein
VLTHTYRRIIGFFHVSIEDVQGSISVYVALREVHVSPGAEVDRLRCVLLGGGTEAECAVVSPSPALERGVVEYGTDVVSTSSDCRS